MASRNILHLDTMFSSPAPRATPRRRARDSTSMPSRGTPSLYSESHGGTGSLARGSTLRHAGPHTPSVRSSRLSILRRTAASPASSAGETIRTARQDGMDGTGTIYARDERICVSKVGGLPKEVQSYVKRADYSTRPVEGHVDPLSGHAFICSYEGCTAWNYHKRTHSSSTCYTFPAPPSAYGGQSGLPVRAALYVPPTSAEPGLVMVNESGEIRFWESMSLALANIDRCQATRLDLSLNDAVERIVRVDGNVFVVTTSSSTAFRLSTLSQSGRVSLHLAPLTRPGGMFGRASPQIFTKAEDRAGIKAVTCVDGFTYLLGGSGTLQKWSMTAEGHRFVMEYNLREILGSALAEQEWVSSGSSVLIEDIEGAGSTQLAVLASTVEQQSTSSFQSSGASTIILFNVDRSHNLTPATAIPISYTSSSSAGNPSLHIPYGSHLAFIKHPDSVVVASLSANEDYENVLSVKDPERNAFIGIGCKDFPVDATRRAVGSPLVTMPITGGLMGMEIYDGPVEKPSDTSTSTAVLKSKIEQAVFYGDRSDNPLSFDLSTELRGNVAQAVEAVSQEILDSSSAHMPPFFELKASLLDRLARHIELISFIRGNGQLSELSQATRRRLMRDAEKSKAAIELWEYQNKLMEHVNTHSPQSQLAAAITSLMDEIGVMGEGDLVRTFFRTQVSRLDRVLEIVLQNLRMSVPNAQDPIERTALVLEANKIVILVIRVASTFREEQGAAYEVDVLRPEIDLWTAKDSLIDGLDFLYTTTEQLIKDRTRTLGSVIDESATGEGREPELKAQRQKQAVLKDQLTQLAAALCAQMEDRLRRVERQMSEGADPQDGLALQKRYESLKPRVIRPLVAIDKIVQAYELAEHHTDFPTLVWLCHEPASATGPTRVQTYVERHGEEFAFVLYQWYIDQGRLHDLMSQDPVYGSLLTKFFESGDHPELAWMHHLACGRFADAADDLMIVNKMEDVLVQKHLISSIAKLAAVVDIKRNGTNYRSKPALSSIDQELELVQLENELREAILSNLPDRRHTKQAIKTYIDTQTASLEDRPAFQSLLAQLIERLLDGEALDIENLIDVLTLNNDLARRDDGALALDRLSRDDSLPESRGQVALLSIWRRVFTYDDWELISKTAGRSEEAQRRLQRGTSTYHTIKAINGILDFPPAYILAPYTCTQSPTFEEIAARFPDWPAAHIDALVTDHASEIALLERCIEECEVEQRVKEIAELVRRDADGEEAEGDGDVSM